MRVSAKASLIHAAVAANTVETEHLQAVGWYATYGATGIDHPDVPDHVMQAQAAHYEAVSLRCTYEGQS